MPPRISLALALAAGAAFVALAMQSTVGTAAAPPNGVRVDQAHPVVVELFQSQGCSSCPPANADLNLIAGRSDVLALSFAVTYWDRLGWKDTFGSPRFTARQQDYADAGKGEVATPEFIVEGTYPVVGANRSALASAIDKARARAGGPSIASIANGVRIDAGQTPASATVWLVRYDPSTREVPIRAGENEGRTLPHRNIVRELVKLGDWSGPARSFALPQPHESGLASAIFIQRGKGGPIVSARKI